MKVSGNRRPSRDFYDENHIAMHFPGESCVQDADHICEYGVDLKLDIKKLEKFCFRQPSEEGRDLIILAGLVHFADKKVRRKRATGWMRNLKLSVPVHNPDFWNQPHLKGLLIEALAYVTGDNWQFNFFKGRNFSTLDAQFNLINLSGEHVVVPYSNGLDSFIQMRTLSSELKPILVTAWNRSQSLSDKKIADGVNGKRIIRLSLPVETHGRFDEPTARTRTFLFYTLAGLAAALSSSGKVMIPENGQGAIGASLVSLGNEHPFRSSHAGFTRKLGLFLHEILGVPIEYSHPFQFKTKGAALQILKENNLLDGWDKTFSCSRDVRDSRVAGKQVHCGICGNCILRRVSVHAADISHSDEYMFDNLNAENFADSAKEHSGYRSIGAHKEIAYNSTMLMEYLARLGSQSPESRVFQRAAFEITDETDMLESTSKQVHSLVKAHAEEWKNFKATLTNQSWLGEHLRRLQ